MMGLKKLKKKKIMAKIGNIRLFWYVFVALALVFLLLWIGYLGYNRYMTIDVAGTVVNGSTGQVFDKGNLTADIGDKRQPVGVDGKFSFSDVRRDGVLKISGPYLYEELRVDINGRSEIEIVVDVSMEQALVLLGQHYKYRRFRSVYEILDEESKSDISEADYLEMENTKRDEVLAGGKAESVGDSEFCAVESVMFENREKDGDRVNMDIVLYMSKECLLEKEISKIYLKQSKESWVWGYIDNGV